MVTTSRILGADGQPIQLDALAEPQTSKVSQLHLEWQGHPSRGLTPSRLNQILVAAEQNDVIAQYELFEDMEERDGHILSEMSKRRRAVSGLAWTIAPPRNPSAKEKRNAEQLAEMMGSIEDFESVVFDTTDGIGKGFCCQETEWHRLGNLWMPKQIVHRPQSWFRLHRGEFTQEVRLRDNSAEGAPLRPFGWVTHTHRAKSGYLERASIFRALVWPYLFKNFSVGDLAEFLEIYGIPLRVGKYPAGASEKEKLTLLRALVQIGRNAAGIIPDGMTLDFHDTADGDAAAFQLMIDWCERTQSKVILGATLTSQADRGSNTNALGNVHNEVRKELKDSDAKQIGSTLSRDLLYPMAALNGLAPDGYARSPRFVLDIAESKDIGMYAESLPKLVSLGMRIPLSWAHQELGIPEADDKQDTLAAAPAAAATTIPPGDAATAAATAQVPNRDPASQMVDQVNRAVDLGQWIDQIREAATRATSLEQLREDLLRIAPELTLDQYAAAMREALTAAALAGRYEILQEAGGAS